MSSKAEKRRKLFEKRQKKRDFNKEKGLQFRKWSQEEVDKRNNDVQYPNQLRPITEAWESDLYLVIVRVQTSFENPDRSMKWLSIKRHDQEPIDFNHWRTLQAIKNEVAGKDVDAVQVFPKEQHLVDMANQYHLWCFDPSEDLSFGFREGRCVSGSADAANYGAKQRELEGVA